MWVFFPGMTSSPNWWTSWHLWTYPSGQTKPGEPQSQMVIHSPQQCCFTICYVRVFFKKWLTFGRPHQKYGLETFANLKSKLILSTNRNNCWKVQGVATRWHHGRSAVICTRWCRSSQTRAQKMSLLQDPIKEIAVAQWNFLITVIRLYYCKTWHIRGCKILCFFYLELFAQGHFCGFLTRGKVGLVKRNKFAGWWICVFLVNCETRENFIWKFHILR